MSDARRRAEEALAKWDAASDAPRYERHADAIDCVIALRSLIAEEEGRGAVAAEIAGLPVHFVAHLPRGRVFMHPDTPKSGARDAWPPPMPSMIPVPIAPAPPPAPDEAVAMDSRCGDCPAREGEPCQTETGNPLWDVHPSRRPAPPPAADEVASGTPGTYKQGGNDGNDDTARKNGRQNGDRDAENGEGSAVLGVQSADGALPDGTTRRRPDEVPILQGRAPDGTVAHAADEVREAAERLTRDDAMTLIGHAEYLRRVHGETDMPRFFDGLAKRLLSALAALGANASPAPKSDEVREAAAERLLTMLYLYPNYRVDGRGPYGLVADALAVLVPELAKRLREGEKPDALLSALAARGGA